MTKIRIAVAILAIITFAALTGTVDAQAAPAATERAVAVTTPLRDNIRSSDGRIYSVGSGFVQCMDLGSYSTGTPVTLAPCGFSNNGSNQWAGDSTGRIYSVGSGLVQCMDLGSYNTGTPVTLAPCGFSNNGSNQWW